MTDSNNDNPGLKAVDVGPRDEVRGAVEASKRNLPALIAHAETQAKIRRALYLAYLSEGFTEAQALELYKA